MLYHGRALATFTSTAAEGEERSASRAVALVAGGAALALLFLAYLWAVSLGLPY